jgi:hypothetical protein
MGLALDKIIDTIADKEASLQAGERIRKLLLGFRVRQRAEVELVVSGTGPVGMLGGGALFGVEVDTLVGAAERESVYVVTERSLLVG